MSTKSTTISQERKELAEAQIQEEQRIVDYDTKEYPVETIVDKYLTGQQNDTNELFIPDYQREMTWDERRQSRFIESVMIGLPIPYLFVADIHDRKENEGRLEIVDGSQRIRTLAYFLTNQLQLQDLEKLDQLNGFRYRDLPPPRQRRFARRSLKMIELTEKADEAVRRDIFERINTGSVELKDMEKRRGIHTGPMLNLIQDLSQLPLFHTLCPFTTTSIKKREPEEFVLRFFAYLDRYEKFERHVNRFLDKYLKEQNAKLKNLTDEDLRIEEQHLRSIFLNMLKFVEQNSSVGFRKSEQHNSTPRIRFEAIAVGTALALNRNPSLQNAQVDMTWLDSKKFRSYTTSDSSNSRPKVKRRIEYVRDKILKGV